MSTATTAEKRNPSHFAIISHPDCVKHDIPSHPEQPARVISIMKAMTDLFDEAVFHQANLVTDEQIELFHHPRHVKLIRSKFVEAGGVWDADSQANAAQHPKEEVYIDGDTRARKGTGGAAYRAAGAAIDAVDMLFSDSPITTVFCCVRPPGHHATRSLAGGFCFFNNAAIAAKYAQHRFGVTRVAVLDFDVHHGNGTEEGFEPFETLFYGSTHEKDNYPGTGIDPSPHVGNQAKSELHRRIVNRTLVARNFMGRECSVREQFRQKWKQVIDEMERFRPEFVIFSAGFDAHDEDPLASCDLLEEDFVWATQIVLDACYRISPEVPINVMSILEGGYDLDALTASAVAHVNALIGGSPQKRKEARKKAAAAATAFAPAGVAAAVDESTPEKVVVEVPKEELDAADALLMANIGNVLAACDSLHLQAAEAIDMDKLLVQEMLRKGQQPGVEDHDLLVVSENVFDDDEEDEHEHEQQQGNGNGNGNGGVGEVEELSERVSDLELTEAEEAKE